MGETPEPLATHRPDCPPALAELLARCLAKEPDARPQTAADVLRAIGEVRTPSGGSHESVPAINIATRRTLIRALGIYAAAFVIVAALAQTAVLLIGLPPWVLPGTLVVMALGLPVILFTAFVSYGSRVARTMTTLTPGGGNATRDSALARLALRASPLVTWRRTAAGGVVAVVGFALLVVTFMAMRAFGIGPAGSLKGRGVIAANDRILVTDFESPASDSALGGVISEGVRTGLAQSTTFGIVPVTQVASALQRMQRPSATHVDLALARQIAEREGIKAIVDGKVTPVAGSFIITATLYATADSVPIASYQETAKDATQIIASVDRATRRVREKLGDSFKNVRQTAPLERVTTASLPALKKYSEGFRLNAMEQNYLASISALEEAVALDSSFAMALRELALVYTNAGLRSGRVDTLLAQAFRHRDRLPELENGLVEAAYYNRAAYADRAKAVAALLRALAVDPRNPSAINALALIYRDRRQLAPAESLWKRMIEYEPDIVFGYTNVLPTQVSMGKLQDAKRTLAAARQRFPDNELVQSDGATVAGAEYGPVSDSVASVCRAVSTGKSALGRVNALGCLTSLAQAHGRLREGLGYRQQAVVGNRQRGATIVTLASALDSAMMMGWWFERPADARRLLDDAIRDRPIRELPPADRQYFSIAELYALAGAPDKAKASCRNTTRT